MLSQLVCKRWYSLIQCQYHDKYNACFPCFDGSPSVGEHSLKKYTTVVDRKFIPHMPAVLLQIKFKSKRSLNLLTVNTMCTNDFRKSQTSTPPPPQPPIPTLIFFSLLCLWSYCMWEVRNDTWRFMVAYHFCIDQILFFSVSRYDLCNMWQMWDDTGRTSWWHIISALIIELRPRYLVL